jgi:hypothetical protein
MSGEFRIPVITFPLHARDETDVSGGCGFLKKSCHYKNNLK